MNVKSAMWVLINWCFSTRPSVVTVLSTNPYISILLWILWNSKYHMFWHLSISFHLINLFTFQFFYITLTKLFCGTKFNCKVVDKWLSYYALVYIAPWPWVIVETIGFWLCMVAQLIFIANCFSLTMAIPSQFANVTVPAFGVFKMVATVNRRVPVHGYRNYWTIIGGLNVFIYSRDTAQNTEIFS